MPRRAPEPQERQRDAERTKQAILDAATEEFAAFGYAGARVEAIAERAGVNKQLISYYFGGKQGLYEEIGRRWRAFESRDLGPFTDLADMVRGYARVAAERANETRLMAWEGLAYAGPASDVGGAERDERLRANSELLVAAQHNGSLDPRFDPAILQLILTAAASAPVVYPQLVRGLSGAAPDDPDFVARFTEQLGLLVELLVEESQRRAGGGGSPAAPFSA